MQDNSITSGFVKEKPSSNLNNLPGVISELGELDSATVINEEAIAQIFRKHPATIKRAIKRGQLPQPVKLGNTKIWTVGVLVEHFENRLKQAAIEAEKDHRRLNNLSPILHRNRRA